MSDLPSPNQASMPTATSAPFASPNSHGLLASSRAGTFFRTMVPALILAGIIFRIAPLFNHNGRLLQQFPTEDGYLMLTIARSMAIGQGMSTADGTIPTNGTQPLMTCVYAAGFWLVDGDKPAGVLVAQVIQIIISLLAAWLLYRLGQIVLANHPQGNLVAGLAAAVWYAAPLCVQHSQNCLETGTYVATVLAVVFYLLAGLRQPNKPWSVRRCLALGTLCGLAFWARNDASLLILGCCLTLVGVGIVHGPSFYRRFAEACIVGTTSVVIASPWLLYNQMRFDHIVPVSGQSEAAFTPFGSNAPKILWSLTEYALLVGGIPHSIEGHMGVLLACALIIAATAVIIAYVWRHGTTPARTLISLVAIYAAGLCVFYGLFFGAGHFMSRYMYPLSPFLALLWAMVVYHVCTRLAPTRQTAVTIAVWVPVLAVLVGLNVRTYAKGDNHMHFQVVKWVQANVPDDVWVGAPQTGTLGFFHDRTINLDGKVNPEALEARLKNQIPQYVLDKNIRYLVDWIGLADEWMKLPLIHENFAVRVADHQQNLAVLERRDDLAHAQPLAVKNPMPSFSSVHQSAGRLSPDGE